MFAGTYHSGKGNFVALYHCLSEHALELWHVSLLIVDDEFAREKHGKRHRDESVPMMRAVPAPDADEDSNCRGFSLSGLPKALDLDCSDHAAFVRLQCPPRPRERTLGLRAPVVSVIVRCTSQSELAIEVGVAIAVKGGRRLVRAVRAATYARELQRTPASLEGAALCVVPLRLGVDGERGEQWRRVVLDLNRLSHELFAGEFDELLCVRLDVRDAALRAVYCSGGTEPPREGEIPAELAIYIPSSKS